MSEQDHTGGCVCGAVRYRVRGAPMRVGLCHCKRCRRETGAPFGAFAVYDRASVTIESGEIAEFESSATGRRRFCRACGSPLFAVWSNSDELDIYLGSLDEPEHFVPSYELWTIRRQSWLPEMPELTHHERDRQD